MATKIITLDDRFSTGEPTVQLVVTPGRDGRALREVTSLHKIASSNSPALDYIKNVEPEPGKSIVLVIGLGDHETYGSNRNGDGFPSKPVPGKIAADDVLTKHFQSYDNAHVFEHHVNHDPAKAIGRVKKAFWNPFMRRVEVLEDFDHAKAPNLLEKIAAGEYPAKSMGCKIPYDVCAICGNRAVTRKDYCDHLRYEMNKVYPDGTKAAALNPRPGFFDSSWVTRPADRTGYLLKKVAYEIWSPAMPSFDLADHVTDLRNKAAALAKAADIEKTISGEPIASATGTDKGTLTLIKRYNDHEAPREAAALPRALKVTVEYTPSEAVGTTDAMGLPMGIKDLLSMFLGRMGDAPATDTEAEAVSKHASFILEVFAEYPRFYGDVLKLAGLEETRVNTKLAAMVDSQHVHSHWGHTPALFDHDKPNTDVMTYTDPTGRTYTTNRGLAQRTTGALADQAQVGKAARGAGYLGAGALMGGAGLGAMLTGGRSPLKRFGGAALAGAGLAAGAKGLHETFRGVRTDDLPGKHLLTNEGDLISGYTEMAPSKYAAWHPEMVYTVVRRVDGACAGLSPERKLALHTQVRTAEVHDELSSLLGPTLDLEKVALILDSSISRA